MPGVKKVIIPKKKEITIMTRRIRMRVKNVLACEKIDMTEVTLIVALIEKSQAEQYLTILNGAKLIQKMFVKILNYCTLVLQSRVFKKSVKNQLDLVWKIILDNIHSKDWLDGRTCLDTAMILLQYESSFLIANGGKDELNVERLSVIIDAMLSRTVRRPPVLIIFQHYSKFLDILEYTWKVLPNYIKPLNFANDIFACNFMTLVNSCKLNVEILAGNRYFYISFEKFEYESTCKSIIAVWRLLLKNCNLEKISLSLHRQILLALKEVFHAHIVLNPLSTTEFLLNSLALGGPTSMLSFENIYMQIRAGEVSIQDVYVKLFDLFEPRNFVFKEHKPRILYLADLFLSSHEIPFRIIVSFVKQLGRLILYLDQDDVFLVMALIKILIKRFTSLENTAPSRRPCYSNDRRRNMVQPLPILSMAFLSSLWVVCDLPVTASREEVKEAAYDIFIGFPIEHDTLSSVLEESDAEAFNSLTRDAIKKVAICYNRSLELHLIEFERSNYRAFF